MDRASGCDCDLLPSTRAHWLKFISTVFGCPHMRLSRCNCLAMVFTRHSVNAQRSFGISSAILPVARGTWLSSLEVSALQATVSLSKKIYSPLFPLSILILFYFPFYIFREKREFFSFFSFWSNTSRNFTMKIFFSMNNKIFRVESFFFFLIKYIKFWILSMFTFRV